MKIADIIEHVSYCATRISVEGAIGAAFGYTYGVITSRDPLFAAKAFAIAALVQRTFSEFVEHGFKYDDDMAKDKRYILWTSLAGTAAIINFHNLELISTSAAKSLGVLLAVVNVVALYKHFVKEVPFYA